MMDRRSVFAKLMLLAVLTAAFFVMAGIMTMTMTSQVAFASQDQKATAFVLCKNRKDVRTIRIISEGDKQDNCTITYSKGRVEQVMGNNRSVSSCKSIMRGIQHNLEASHWSCRTVQSAMVTTGSELGQQ
jgi:hypothetical protein